MKRKTIESDAERCFRMAWEERVLKRFNERCGNCGSEGRVTVIPIVPLEAGGQMELGNGMAICRACLLARSTHGAQTPRDAPVVLWVSRQLSDAVLARLGASTSAYKSMSGLVDGLIELYVRHPDQFEDLALYQDEGNDAKLNLRAESERYEVFKTLVRARGLTITDAIKALLLIFLTTPKES